MIPQLLESQKLLMKRNEDIERLNRLLSPGVSTTGNDKEVILLDFNHFYDMNPADHAKLASMLQTTFGNKLAPASLGADVTLNQLWSTSYRIIIFYDHAATVDSNPFLWSQSTISSPWPNVQDVGALHSALADKLPNEGSTFFVLQGILTPDGAMIAAGLVPFSSAPSSLTGVAQAVTPAVVGWLSQWGNQGINIVICDWFNCTNAYVNMLLQMNATPATAADAASLQNGELDLVVTSHVDPEKLKQEIANGMINEADIAALAAAEYRTRFGQAGHSQEVVATLQELDRIAATASVQPKKLGEKAPVVQTASKLVAKAEAKKIQLDESLRSASPLVLQSVSTVLSSSSSSSNYDAFLPAALTCLIAWLPNKLLEPLLLGLRPPFLNTPLLPLVLPGVPTSFFALNTYPTPPSPQSQSNH
ncbi:PLC-like phosphodiesterase [Mycena olivaceomarginata]|nr:PLC-like phosphodiesterase [Mycena olivaceomarginata]